MKKTVNFLKTLFTKKYVAPETKPDFDRSVVDLAYDVKQKRKLIRRLLKENKRLRMAFQSSTFFLIIFVGFSVYSHNFINIEKGTFDYYYSNFKQKYVPSQNIDIANFNNVSEIIENSNFTFHPTMLKAIVAIEKKDYTKAAMQLSGEKTGGSQWLRALCLFRMNEKPSAKVVLTDIVDRNSLFSLDAQDILDNHYSCKK